MRAACEWIIQDNDIARSDFDCLQRGRNSHRHRAKMHGHVIALRYYATGTVKDRARVIAALFDVRREGSAPERDAHLFRD